MIYTSLNNHQRCSQILLGSVTILRCTYYTHVEEFMAVLSRQQSMLSPNTAEIPHKWLDEIQPQKVWRSSRFVSVATNCSFNISVRTTRWSQNFCWSHGRPIRSVFHTFYSDTSLWSACVSWSCGHRDRTNAHDVSWSSLPHSSSWHRSCLRSVDASPSCESCSRMLDQRRPCETPRDHTSELKQRGQTP